MNFEEVHFLTGSPGALLAFYRDTIGFPVLDQGKDHFVMQAGTTRIRFDRAEGRPCYHFAFNVPSFYIRTALEWLRQRVEIQPMNGEDIVPFPNWNAEAVYFYDPAGNIVEFIARKNLGIGMEGEFGADQVLCLSEVGWPCVDVEAVLDRLMAEMGLEVYSGGLPVFCAAGDETGLFILVDPTQKKWIPNMDPARPFPFRCLLRSHRLFDLVFDGQEMRVHPMD